MKSFWKSTFAGILLAGLSACSGGTPGLDNSPVPENGATQLPQTAETAMPEDPATVLSLPAPQGVDNAVWQEITREFSSTARKVSESHLPDTFAEVSIDTTEYPYTLHWEYTLTGDYDFNGLVSLSDLTVIGRYFGMTDKDPGWEYAQAADGNHNGLISLSDVTPVGYHYGERCDFFMIEKNLGSLVPLWQELKRVERSTGSTTPGKGLVPQYSYTAEQLDLEKLRVYAAGPETLVPPSDFTIYSAEFSEDLRLGWTKSTAASGYRVLRDKIDYTPFDVGDNSFWRDPAPFPFEPTGYWVYSVAGDEKSSISPMVVGYNFIRSISLDGSATDVPDTYDRFAFGNADGLFIFYLDEDHNLRLAATDTVEINLDATWTNSVVNDSNELVHILGVTEHGGRIVVACSRDIESSHGGLGTIFFRASTAFPASPPDWESIEGPSLLLVSEYSHPRSALTSDGSNVHLAVGIQDLKVQYIRSTTTEFKGKDDFSFDFLDMDGYATDILALPDRVCIAGIGVISGSGSSGTFYTTYAESTRLDPGPDDWFTKLAGSFSQKSEAGLNFGERSALCSFLGVPYIFGMYPDGYLYFDPAPQNPVFPSGSGQKPGGGLKQYADHGTPLWAITINGLPVVQYEKNGNILLAWLYSEPEGSKMEWRFSQLKEATHTPGLNSEFAEPQLTQYRGKPVTVTGLEMEGVVQILTPRQWPATGYVRNN